MLRHVPARPKPAAPLRAALPRRPERQYLLGEYRRYAPSRRWCDRTSKPGSPATGPTSIPSNCSGKPPHQFARQPHEHEPAARTTDAMHRELHEPRSRGRSVVFLYNTVRPHSSLGYRPPAPEAIVPRGGAYVPWPGALALNSARLANPSLAAAQKVN
jgi:hypothetical protein